MLKAFAAVIPLAAVMAAQQGSMEPCGGRETWIAPDSAFFSLPLPAPAAPSTASAAPPAPAFIVPPPVGTPGAPPALPQDVAPATE
jgi:hypothetical protein